MTSGVSVVYRELDHFSERYRSILKGIHHVQLFDLPADISDLRENLAEGIRKIRSENPQLTFSVHAAVQMNLAEDVPEIQKIWLELAKKTIYFAREIGAVFVNFHAGKGGNGTRSSRERTRRALVPVLEALIEAAAACGLEFHLENTCPVSRYSEFCKMGDRANDFRFFFDHLDSPTFKLCYDYGHGNLEEDGIRILRDFSTRLGSVHVHDNNELLDQHLSVGDPDGTINWPQELDFLEQIDFKGPFILESSAENQLKSMSYLKTIGRL
jgi:sugar phosphate isomerase/epimerase